MNRGTSPDIGRIVTKEERRWVWIFGLVVMIITTVPYLIGYASQGEQWRFTGFVYGVEDGNSYIAKMLTGAEGAWLFRTPYTTHPQNGVIAFLPYLLIGKLSARPGQHEQLVALYQLFRIICGFLTIHATYDFIAIFLNEKKLRKLSTAIATLGGGLGWLLVLLGKVDWLGSLPLEFYSPESFGFLSVFGIAHLNLARAALFWALTVYLRTANNFENIDKMAVLKLGSLWLLAALAQPITAIVLGVVIGLHLMSLCIYQFWIWKSTGTSHWRIVISLVRYVILAGFIPAPFILYNLIAFNSDPFLIAWTAQNIIMSPHPFHYLFAYGMMLPFAYWGGKRLLSLTPITGLLPVTWLISLPVLAYLPFNLQRRLPEGLWVIIVLMALFSFQEKASMGIKSSGFLLPLSSISFISSMFLLSGGILAASTPAQPLFRPSDEVEAFNFLAEHANTGGTVLAAYPSSNALPAWAPLKVVVGHGPESVGSRLLNPEIRSFYGKDTTDHERKEFLEQQSIDFVFWGPDERELGGWNPNDAPFLEREFNRGKYYIFSVKTIHD